MTPVYPGLDSPEFAQDFATIVQDIQHLAALFDSYQIQEKQGLAVDSEVIQTFEAITAHRNAVLERTKTLSVYISCFVTTNSHDNLAQARASALQRSLVILSQLSTRLTAWLGSLDAEALIAGSAVALEHAYTLRKAKEQAEHLMSPAEESLAAELNVSSGTAWARLHGNITSQLTLPVEVDGETRELPMSIVRNMAYDADRAVRRRAYEAELEGWKKVALPLAAALNSIKNEVNVLAQRRRWQSSLEASLFSNSIDRQTLDAMLSAAKASFPDFRRYLQAKSRALGLSRLAWYDLFAPLGTENRTWKFDEASAFIIEQFGTYSERLSGFAARAFHEHWIDAEPRPGKRDGAYCTSLRGDESRVFANYKPSFGGASTLAHELGHGYHNVNLAQRTSLQRSHPMTLAETASIFCETIIRQGSCMVVVDITSRFLFEQRVFEKRQQRELSVDELNELMLEAQRETYGDGLDGAYLHPYMWAMKPHYYSTGRSYWYGYDIKVSTFAS
jgi:oligoendopeptidase F